MVSLHARRLTEVHRLAQVQLGAQTAALVATTFPLLDHEDLNGSFPNWLHVVTPIVQAQRAKSSGLAGAYLSAMRSIELGNDDRFDAVLAGDAPLEQITTSMLVTGVVALRSRLAVGMDVARALEMSRAGSAAAATRIALDAGRDTVTNTVRKDPRARGWERVTSGAACDFCELLAERGVVYSEESADFESHDHCYCQPEPAYS